MTVAEILRNKDPQIWTVPPRASLQTVIDMLATKHIGAVVIADRWGAMLGIVSERDVVRALSRRSGDGLDDIVYDHMTDEVFTACETDSVIDVAKRMSEGRFRHMPVLKNGLLVGIVSQGDIVKYRLEQMETEQKAMKEFIAAG